MTRYKEKTCRHESDQTMAYVVQRTMSSPSLEMFRTCLSKFPSNPN